MDSIKVFKAHHQRTVVELLDLLETHNSRAEKIRIKNELKKRNLSNEDLTEAKAKLEKLRAYRKKRAEEPLSFFSKILFVIAPFFFHHGKNSELFPDYDRWSEHGFNQKKEEYTKYSSIGCFLYIILIISLITSLLITN